MDVKFDKSIKQIALLRGINVSGKNKIKMEDLRKLFKNMGFENVNTYIQTGNVIFQSNDDIQTNQKIIKENIKTSFGSDIETIVFYENKLKRVLENNIFLNKKYDSKALYYCFLSTIPATDIVKELLVKATLNEEICLVDDILYLYYPNGIGKSKITNVLIESKLKSYSTIRNHNTVIKLNELKNKSS